MCNKHVHSTVTRSSCFHCLIGVINKPTTDRVVDRSTQPCIPLGSLNRVPASTGVRAGISPLPGGR